MNAFLLLLALIGGQMNTLQDKPTVRLRPGQSFIQTELGGHVVELRDPPKIVQLPAVAPVRDFQGKPWSVELKNLGPGTVTILGSGGFSIEVKVHDTTTINSTTSGYFIPH